MDKLFSRLSKIVCFIILVNIISINFNGSANKVAQASSIKTAGIVGYEIKTIDSVIAFDFTKELGTGEIVESFNISSGDGDKGEFGDSTKKIWSTLDVFIHGKEYPCRILNAKGDAKNHLSFNFLYQDMSKIFNPKLKYASNGSLEIDFSQVVSKIGLEAEDKVEIEITKPNGLGIGTEVSKTGADLSKASNKIVFTEAEIEGIRSGAAYLVVFRIQNKKEYKHRFYVYSSGENKKIDNLEISVETASRNDDKTVNLNVKATGVGSISNSSTLEIVDESGVKTGTYKSGVFEFKNLTLSANSQYVFTYNGNSQTIYNFCSHEGIVGFNGNVDVSPLTSNKAKVTLSNSMNNYFSSTAASNKIRINDIQENGFNEDKKLGEKASVVKNIANEISLSSGLESNKNYIVTFENGTNKFYTTFTFSPIIATVSEETQTNVKIQWTYPSKYKATSGDRIDVYVKEVNQAEYPSQAKLTLIHGSGGVDLSKVSSGIISHIAPSTNYSAKVVLSNQSGSTETKVDFSTLVFGLKDHPVIKDALLGTDKWQEAYPRSRHVIVEWDFEPANMEFGPEDKVEVFVKPDGSSDFSGYPSGGKYSRSYFIATENLNEVKSANISFPEYYSKYILDVIYTIGGKKIITSRRQGETDNTEFYNRKIVKPYISRVSMGVDKIKENSANIFWVFDKLYTQPENAQQIIIDFKESTSDYDRTKTDFPLVLYDVSHNVDNGNILEKFNVEVGSLKPDQWYRSRTRHMIQGKTKYVDEKFNVNYYSFKTLPFVINKPTSEIVGKKAKVIWSHNSPDIVFGEQDKINIYLKDSTTSEYLAEPTKVLTDMSLMEVNIDLPEFNKLYNIKIEYVIKGKSFSNYGSLESKINNLSAQVKNIATDGTTATVSWEYPVGYTPEAGDKIDIFMKASTDSQYPQTPVDTISNLDTKEYVVSGLTSNNGYVVKCVFTAAGSLINEVELSFIASSDLQITGLNATNIGARDTKIEWNYSPSSYAFGSSDDIQIFLKKTTDASYPSTPTHTFDNSSIVTAKEYNFTGLQSNISYDAKIQYRVAAVSDLQPAEVTFKTIVQEFKASVLESTQTSAKYEWIYPEGYEIVAGDKINIYVKLEEEETFSNPLLILEHGTGEGKYDLNDITAVDISGLTPEKNYVSRVEFITNSFDIRTDINISTKAFTILEFKVDSYEEYDILVNWKIEPNTMKFNDTDKVEIFAKLSTDEVYPADPVFRVQGFSEKPEESIDKVFDAYVQAVTIGATQNMKLVYTIGDKKYEKELEVTNTIDPLAATVIDIKETRALVEIKYPQNYTFVLGDKVKVYAQDEWSQEDSEIENDNFLVFEATETQDDTVNEMSLIQIQFLYPETSYKVRVKLELVDGTLAPIDVDFVTEAVKLSDITIDSIKFDETALSWNIGDNIIDFYLDDNYNFSDKLIIAWRDKSTDPIPEDPEQHKALSHVEYLGEELTDIKSQSIKVEDINKDYDVFLYYDIGGWLYTKQTSLSFLTLSSDENKITDKDAEVSWKYPSNITFGESDIVSVFVRKDTDSNYPESPAFTKTGGITDITTFKLTGLESSTKYIAKVEVQTAQEGFSIAPMEVTFETRGAVSSEVVLDTVEYELVGIESEFVIPEGIIVDESKEPVVKFENEAYDFEILYINSGDSKTKLTGDTQSYKIEKLINNDEVSSYVTRTEEQTISGFIIKPLIPKKTYKNCEIKLPLKDGTDFKMTIKEFTSQPSNTAQDWLSNAYWFAFERLPDEGGYLYWYDRMSNLKDLSGEYFLKNLLFAEDEFANRGLSDRDLIAALYQIVVNREYDEEGLNFWVGIYNENLVNANGDKKLAQEAMVNRMIHEPEFGRLCEKLGIYWTQKQQDEAAKP